ncbi:MAG: lipid A export permease/ATP-binding protein MsbA [Desulfopila sp.]
MNNKEILARLFQVIQPYRGKLMASMVTMICFSGFTAAQAWILKPVIDEIFFNKNITYLAILPLGIVLIFLLKALSYYFYTFMLELVGQSIIRDMRLEVFRHINSQSLSFFHQYPTGNLISRVISDVSQMQSAVSNALVGCLRDSFQMIFLLGLVFYLNWHLAMFTFIIIPLAVVPIVTLGRRFRKLSTRTQEETARLSDRLYESITGNRIVKAFSREEYENKRFGDQIDKLFAITIKDARLRSLQHPLMEFIGGLAIALIIWFGGKEVIYGSATPGTFFSFLTALIAAYEPIKSLSKVNPLIQRGLAAANRIFTLLDIKADIVDRQNAITLPPFRRDVIFREVSFNYEPDTPVLHNLDLRVPRGEALAIVGSSGGGKTTLTNLIPRFLDIDSGSITIDGIDIRDVTMASLRQQISMVTQQTILFNDTVRNNIAYGDLNASEDAIRGAAEAAYALKFIEQLPHGLNTIIGEGGARLSGGERQRISIARAILKNAPILILDEATSALDTESEREVQKALENLMKNKTTFVIAHRLSTIVNCDRIIVVKHGRIIEEGTHQELLAQKGEYELLYTMQFKQSALQREN